MTANVFIENMSVNCRGYLTMLSDYVEMVEEERQRLLKVEHVAKYIRDTDWTNAVLEAGIALEEDPLG